jgi:hypothetical protein
VTVQEKADELLRRCEGGFANEFEWANWLAKHEPEINALPPALRRAVRLAHHNATAKEFSRGH